MNPPDYEALSKGLSRDMSPEAIARRLKIASELFELARVLSRAHRVGKVEKDLSIPPPADASATARDRTS